MEKTLIGGHRSQYNVKEVRKLGGERKRKG